MSDGHTGITDELDDMDITSSGEEDTSLNDAVLEWDYSADISVKPSTSSQSKPNDDDRSAYELAEYIVEEFVPKQKQKRARKLIKLWKSGKRAYRDIF